MTKNKKKSSQLSFVSKKLIHLLWSLSVLLIIILVVFFIYRHFFFFNCAEVWFSDRQIYIMCSCHFHYIKIFFPFISFISSMEERRTEEKCWSILAQKTQKYWKHMKHASQQHSLTHAQKGLGKGLFGVYRVWQWARITACNMLGL